MGGIQTESSSIQDKSLAKLILIYTKTYSRIPVLCLGLYATHTPNRAITFPLHVQYFIGYNAVLTTDVMIFSFNEMTRNAARYFDEIKFKSNVFLNP